MMRHIDFSKGEKGDAPDHVADMADYLANGGKINHYDMSGNLIGYAHKVRDRLVNHVIIDPAITAVTDRKVIMSTQDGRTSLTAMATQNY